DLEADILQHEGRWREARTKLENAVGDSVVPRGWAEGFGRELAWLLVRQGEPEAAIQAIANVNSDWADELRLVVRRRQAELDAFRDLEAPSYIPAPDGDFTRTLARADDDASWNRVAVRAGIVPEENLQRMDAAVTALAAHVARVAPTDPPWSR